MELLTIGGFARAAGLTPKALRLYDEQGLLRPAAVDAANGYRFYTHEQLGRARLIARLRRVDMPLARIREVCDLPPAEAAAVVAEFRTGVEADAAARAHEAGLLVDLLTGRETTMTTLGLKSAARTAIGLVRTTNEDAAYADDTVLAVADGLGGLPNGHEASAAAVAAVRSGDGDLATRIAAASRTIKAMGGPATTLTALVRSGDRLLLAHIGDTRAYLLRNEELARLTQDHSYVQTLVDSGKIGPGDAADHPKRPVLLRALGATADDDLDLGQRAMLAGDRYLLCSDGLWAHVPPAELAAALPGGDPGTAADRLIELAHTHGAPDNVAVVVADVLVAD
ncbi:MerR family transcriptional regulator [Actinoplanes sp. NPDC049265]|uniref:MerR family transcriptional regulator n=1 Tax=Actinoplanes sp. NPDC049265 TaxID=3363902 RepID=UPI0037127F1A